MAPFVSDLVACPGIRLLSEIDGPSINRPSRPILAHQTSPGRTFWPPS